MNLAKNIYKPCFLLVITALLSVGCGKKKEVTPAQETGTVTDQDGNVYRTVKIGSQWWMAENLKAKTFANHDSITNAQLDADWTTPTSAYCLYDKNDRAPGLLYNWYAVADGRKIAPPGWHIPNDDEWKTLEQQLGMSGTDANKVSWRGSSEGNKLKIASPEGWTINKNVWATNETGFTALAGSCRLFNGKWGGNGGDLFHTGFWWSTTEHDEAMSWYRYLDYQKSGVFRFYADKRYGCSIRCIKD